MKTYIAITMSLVLAAAAARAQTLSAYQGVINSQSPLYFNDLSQASGYAPSVGTGTFTPTVGTISTTGYFGNANEATGFTNTTAQLTLANGNTVINNSGNNSIGSLSMVLQAPDTVQSSTRYIFDNGDTSPNEFRVVDNAGVLSLQIGNKTLTDPVLASMTLDSGMWYYFAATWDFSGANSSSYGIHYYLGVAGQPTSSLLSGFTQRGGTGNISSTAQIGGGGAVTVSGNLAGSGNGFQDNGVPGSVEELATWSTQLTSDQINSQFGALITSVPEPSSFVLCVVGGLLALLWTRKFVRDRETNRA